MGCFQNLSVMVTYREREGFTSAAKCQLLQHTHIAEHYTPTHHTKQGGRLPEGHRKNATQGLTSVMLLDNAYSLYSLDACHNVQR